MNPLIVVTYKTLTIIILQSLAFLKILNTKLNNEEYFNRPPYERSSDSQVETLNKASIILGRILIVTSGTNLYIK